MATLVGLRCGYVFYALRFLGRLSSETKMMTLEQNLLFASSIFGLKVVVELCKGCNPIFI